MESLYVDFLREIQFNSGYSTHTVSAYRRDLAYYEDFCKTKQPINKFYYFLTEKKLSASSQARIISCVRSYLKFVQKRGHPAQELKSLKVPRINKKLPQAIKLSEFLALWQACESNSDTLSIRNKLILACLYGLGCRVSELVSMNIQDFNETESWISVVGKGNKQRLLPLTQNLYALLQLYLKKCRPCLIQKKNSALFVNNKGRRPSRVDIWRWLKLWSLKAGFKKVKNPHSFRHGCATGLLEGGADLRSIQKLLGHFSIQSTQIYTSVSSKNLKSTIDKFHPLSQIKKSA